MARIHAESRDERNEQMTAAWLRTSACSTLVLCQPWRFELAGSSGASSPAWARCLGRGLDPGVECFDQLDDIEPLCEAAEHRCGPLADLSCVVLQSEDPEGWSAPQKKAFCAGSASGS